MLLGTSPLGREDVGGEWWGGLALLDTPANIVSWTLKRGLPLSVCWGLQIRPVWRTEQLHSSFHQSSCIHRLHTIRNHLVHDTVRSDFHWQYWIFTYEDSYFIIIIQDGLPSFYSHSRSDLVLGTDRCQDATYNSIPSLSARCVDTDIAADPLVTRCSHYTSSVYTGQAICLCCLRSLVNWVAHWEALRSHGPPSPLPAICFSLFNFCLLKFTKRLVFFFPLRVMTFRGKWLPSEVR